ncbi:MAG: DoxX family protein [Myxococcota bacterium]
MSKNHALMSKHVPTVAQVLIGLVMTVFGLNGFLNFLPQPPASPAGGAFLGALAATGYMFPMVKVVEILAGVALLTSRFVPLALVLLAPITVNIFTFHVILSPEGAEVAVALLVGHLYLAYAYRQAYAPLFEPRPVAQDASKQTPNQADESELNPAAPTS